MSSSSSKCLPTTALFSYLRNGDKSFEEKRNEYLQKGRKYVKNSKRASLFSTGLEEMVHEELKFLRTLFGNGYNEIDKAFNCFGKKIDCLSD